MLQFNSMPRFHSTRLDRLTSTNSVVIRCLALIGIVLLVERSTNIYLSKDSLRVMNNVQDHNQTANIIDNDRILSYNRHNSGTMPNGDTKAIVVASTTWEDTTWITEHLSDWALNIYVVNDLQAPLTIPRQAGNEASVFLTYLITHYYSLPNYIVFIHATRYQWHNDNPMYDGLPSIQSLNLSYVQHMGYTSLRCTWDPGCPGEMKPARNLSWDIDAFGIRDAYHRAYTTIFADEISQDKDSHASSNTDIAKEVPTIVGAPCCAQFAVSRAQILKTPLIRHELARQWLWDTAADLPASVSGRVMEYLWHILFGMDAVSCPNTQVCFCQGFGLCNLKCPSEGYCEGRYWKTAFGMGWNKKWPVEGQGENGFPSYGWWQSTYPNETFNLTHTDMRNHLDPASDLNGATGEGMSAAELLKQEAKLKEMMREEDRGEVFREEWEVDYVAEAEARVKAEAEAEDV